MDAETKKKILELLDKIADGFDEYRTDLSTEDYMFWGPWEEAYNFVDGLEER